MRRLSEALLVTAAFSPEQYASVLGEFDRSWIEEALAATGVATLRRRRLPMEQVVWLVVAMSVFRDRNIAELAGELEIALPDGESRTTAPSAIAQARCRLGVAPVEWLFLRTATEWGHESARREAWRELALYAVDGTTLRVPDSDENRRHFGGQVTHRGPSGYPQLRLVALMAVRSHLLVAAEFGPYATDERAYAAGLWSHVPNNSLTLIDRCYLQANVLVPLGREGTNRHWLTRAKKNSAWTKLKTLGPGDELVEMKVSSAARAKDPTLPKTMVVRAIRYRRPKGQPQVLLTSLLDAERYPAAELCAIYHERWEIELGYDELKTEQLDREEALRSKTPATVAQEMWGILVGYNLVRKEMEGIADEIGVPPTRISFVRALHHIASELFWVDGTRSPGKVPRNLGNMRDKIRRFLLPPRRAKRSYPRAVKVKMSNYARNRRAK
jgi:hypothetical protein